MRGGVKFGPPEQSMASRGNKQRGTIRIGVWPKESLLPGAYLGLRRNPGRLDQSKKIAQIAQRGVDLSGGASYSRANPNNSQATNGDVGAPEGTRTMLLL